MKDFFTPFATAVQRSNLNNKTLNDELVKFAKTERKKIKGRTVSNVGGFQSEIYDPLKNEPSILKDFINATVPYLNKYVKYYEIKEPYTIEAVETWININGGRDYNLHHSHSGGLSPCDFSGVYYAQVPKNSGHLVLINPDSIALQQKFYYYENNHFNQFNSGKYTIEPKDMDLVLFSSHIYHHVLPNYNSTQSRISYSFNFNICKP